MKFMVETSARHIHLTQESVEKLFGEAMMQRTKKLGRWKDSTFLKEKMKKVLFPESEGIAR